MNINLTKGKFREFSRMAAFSCATTSLLFIGIIPPAEATSISGCGEDSGVCANGSIVVFRDQVTWDLTVRDNKKDGNCAYAILTIDRNNVPDRTFRSQNACGKGKTVKLTGSAAYYGTRGARLVLCEDRNLQEDQCTQTHYENEDN